MTIGAMFAGIGGLELGLEAIGAGSVIWQAENNPYAVRVLEKNWSGTRPVGAEPVGVGNGVPRAVDRIRCLGNAVVPLQAAYAFNDLYRRINGQT